MQISFRTVSKDCWKRDNIKIKREGSSSYKVIVEGSTKEENIICTVPNVHSLLSFLSRLFNDATPIFQSQESDDFNPMDKCN